MFYHSKIEYHYEKKFSTGDSDFSAPLVYSYPSVFPGIDIFEIDQKYLGGVLGLTGGRFIVLQKSLGSIRDFVLAHEEEHVKDMSADEMEIDRRALKKIKNSSRITKPLLGKIKKLMKARWGVRYKELLKELSDDSL
jgi:hypothetical protein